VLRRATRTLLATFGVAAALLLSGCSSNGFLPDSATEQGDDVTTLWKGVIAAGIFVALFMWTLIGIAAFRGRAASRRDPDAIPGQRQDNLKLELFYFGVPVLICIALFVAMFPVQEAVTEVEPDPDLVVEVVGYQWGWQFRYLEVEPGQPVPEAGHDAGAGTAEALVVVTGAPDQPPVLVLPTDRTVRLELVADDVIHSFWVPDFITKRDLIPGVDNEIDVNLNETGTYVGRCAEFCGLEHWAMTFSVESMAPDDFDAWMAEAADLEQPVVGSVEAAQQDAQDAEAQEQGS